MNSYKRLKALNRVERKPGCGEVALKLSHFETCCFGITEFIDKRFVPQVRKVFKSENLRESMLKE
jgi:hypothetical protein